MESGPGMQRAYGVLDKFKVSRTFFIKTDQTSCETLPTQEEAIDPTPVPGSTYGPPVAASDGTGLDAVLLDGPSETDTNKIGEPDLLLGADDQIIEVGGEQEVLINLAENYVPITNNIGYHGKDVVGEKLTGGGVEEEKKTVQEEKKVETPIPAKSIVEVLKKAAEVEAEAKKEAEVETMEKETAAV